jgi:hypothetical protein
MKMEPLGDVEATAATSRLRLATRLLAPAVRKRLEAAIRAGRLRQVDEVDLLAPERLPAVARRSLALLLASGAGFVALGLAARVAHHPGPLLGGGPALLRIAGFLAANAAAYVVMVPLHEGVHAGVILVLGGRPRFGLKLPFAAYCTAPGQLFVRNGYIAVALAPLVVLSAAGAVATWLAPDLGACLLFGLAGNVAGAVGDLEAASRLRRLAPHTLIADTETGYTAAVPVLD